MAEEGDRTGGPLGENSVQGVGQRLNARYRRAPVLSSRVLDGDTFHVARKCLGEGYIKGGRPAGVRVFPFPFESPKMNYGLYWHGRQTADPAHAWLRGVIIEAATPPSRNTFQ